MKAGLELDTEQSWVSVSSVEIPRHALGGFEEVMFKQEFQKVRGNLSGEGKQKNVPIRM